MRFFILFYLSLGAAWTTYAEEAAGGLDHSKSVFAEQQVYPVLRRSIDTTSQSVLATGAIAVFLTEPQDDSIRDQWVNHQKMDSRSSRVGDVMGSGLAGVLVLGGQYFYDTDENHWQSHARALVFSTTVSSVMKYAIGRPRPGSSRDHYSFPSGHTTAAFATATSMAYAYGWEGAVIAYPMAIFVGLSRLADDAHWGSDVVAGAFIGFWAARASSYSLESTSASSSRSIWIPVVETEQLGVKWVYQY